MSTTKREYDTGRAGKRERKFDNAQRERVRKRKAHDTYSEREKE